MCVRVRVCVSVCLLRVFVLCTLVLCACLCVRVVCSLCVCVQVFCVVCVHEVSLSQGTRRNPPGTAQHCMVIQYHKNQPALRWFATTKFFSNKPRSVYVAQTNFVLNACSGRFKHPDSQKFDSLQQMNQICSF